MTAWNRDGNGTATLTRPASGFHPVVDRRILPYALASYDDPPVALFCAKPPAMGKEKADPTHSANSGVGLRRCCKALGIGCEFPGTPDAERKKPTGDLIQMLTGK